MKDMYKPRMLKKKQTYIFFKDRVKDTSLFYVKALIYLVISYGLIIYENLMNVFHPQI